MRFLLALLTVSLLPIATIAAEPEIKMTPITFAGLDEAIKSHKGKVVVVDVWGDFCIPCKQKFPAFVKLHHTYSKDGLVCLSLSLDETDDSRARALKFLQKMKATFSNYYLDDTDANKEKWNKTYPVVGPPIYYVFDRTGKQVKIFAADEPFESKDVEELVKKLLTQN